MSRPFLSLSIIPEALEPCGNLFQREDGSDHDSESRLLATVEILNVLHHLEFIEVTDHGDGQRAVIPELESSLDAAYEISAAAPFQTVTYKSRSYIVLLTPFEA